MFVTASDRQADFRQYLRHVVIGGTLLTGLIIGGWVSATSQGEQAAKIQQLGSPRVEVTAEGRLRITLSFQVLDAAGRPVRELPASEGTILEDGNEVHRFRPQQLAGRPREVMLALDTSGSMIGTPERPLDRLDKAKEAAERFVQQLAPNTPCGLVLFHHEPYVSLRLSVGTRDNLLTTIRQARGAGGTAYFDAAIAAMQNFSADRDKARALVLLTDGRDVNSKNGPAQVIEEANKRQVNIYTIGLGKPGANLHIRSLLILDRSGSMKAGNKIAYLRQAAQRYLELMPRDHADCSLLPFDDRYERPKPPSADIAALRSEVAKLTPRGGTHLFDVTLLGLEWLAQDSFATAAVNGRIRECRRVIVLLTDGINEGGRIQRPAEFFQQLSKLHAQANIPIFVIGLGDPRRGEIDEKVLRQIAQLTGGQYYGVSDPAHLQAVFEQLSIDIHDEGIDEASLRELAEKTGGRYFHAAEAGELARQFGQALQDIETTFTITYLSPRTRQDGTPSRIEIRLGTLQAQASYRTHGVITPAVDLRVFFLLLAVLVALGIVPIMVRRLSQPSK
ncbi:MAG: VWA domain-containing protein [Gemmatales bacterium]|nr:VWA domain-containing protein [Gemmatales bacterium]MCS7160030.1 VWA domain-containing protein [Gemmatales bacterium]MDW8175229.1 VWA domain-containing protein [Gemmatales bacterium]MDW8222477.1 VWA domain-containing protein [Gemmatales bacterium]